MTPSKSKKRTKGKRVTGQPQESRARQPRRPKTGPNPMTMVMLLVMGLSAIALGGFQYWKSVNPDRPSVEEIAASIQAPDWDEQSDTVVTAPTPTPTAAPNATPTAVAAARRRVPGWPRMRIAAIGVDAPISNKSMVGNVMQDPETPEEVAWYDFSSQPGGGGNVVMAGHVDFHDYGAAVFASLSSLGPGDSIQIARQNGTVYTYQVTSVRSYNLNSIPTADLIAQTAKETLTIITCSGAWNGRAHGYDSRLVVRAALIKSGPAF